VNTNTILRQITTALSLDEVKVSEAFKLAALEISPARISAILSEEGSRDFKVCSYEELL